MCILKSEGVKKYQEIRKCVLFIETKTILLNRDGKKCDSAKVTVDFFFLCSSLIHSALF